MASFRKHELPIQTLAVIGQYIVEWAEFESLFTLTLAVLIGFSKRGQAEAPHEFLRRFRIWSDLLGAALTDPGHLKKLESLKGRIGASYDHRQWMAHGIIEDMDFKGMKQALYPPSHQRHQRDRWADRDLLESHLEQLQSTVDKFNQFVDEVLWPLVEPSIRKSPSTGL